MWPHELLCWHCGRGGVGSPGSCSGHRHACHGLQATNEAELHQSSDFNGYQITPGTISKMNYGNSLSEK